jgi:uncharacterized protein
MLTVKPPQTHSLYTQDGLRLDADVYFPEAAGTFPVLLMRQPYGRAIASTVVYAHPSWYAAHGYIVVIQDVRGRGTSEGEFKLFESEIADGYDTVNWAAQLPQSSGQVGMYGFSYQGMTQLYAAVKQPPALKALCPAMLGYDLYHDWAYEGGAFCLQANLSWAIQIAAETAKRAGDEAAFLKLAEAARHLPLSGAIPAVPEILQVLAPDSFYHDWIRRPASDPYWQKLSPHTYGAQIDLPMLHIGGWFDPFLRGTLHLYQTMGLRQGTIDPRHQLWIGPWGHLPWGSRVGSVNYGAAAVSPCDRLQIRWFDHFLKGIDTGLLAEPPVNLFEMGRQQWRHFAELPCPDPQSYFLASRGLASLDGNDGTLSGAVPDPALPAAPDVIVHDPWRPVPALGGHAVAPSGSYDRSALDCRSDILTYTSAPLTTALQLTGTIVVEIYCTADTPSFDLCAVLSEVHPNGRVDNFTQGYRRVTAPESPVTIRLQPTCIAIAAGQALRLSLSGACFPAYPVNSGTGAPPYEEAAIAAQVITLTVHHDADRPSRIRLPQLES